MQFDSEKHESLTLSATESQKAWHLVGLLLSLGKPTHLPDLVSRCTLFPASPSAIAALSSLPGSPIALTTEDLVTLSLIGLAASVSYVERSFNLARVSASPPIIDGNFSKMCLGKRKRLEDEEQRFVQSIKRIRSNWTKVHNPIVDDVSRIIRPSRLSGIEGQVMCLANNLSLCENSSFKIKQIETVEDEAKIETVNEGEPNMNMSEELAAGKVYVKLGCPTRILNQEMDAQETVNISSVQFIEYFKQSCVSSMGTQSVDANHEATYVRIPNNKMTQEGCRREVADEFFCSKRGMEDVSTSFNIGLMDMPLQRNFTNITPARCKNKTPSQVQKPRIVSSTNYSLSKALESSKAVRSLLEKNQYEDQKSISTVQKSNQNLGHKQIKERTVHSTSISSKDRIKSKQLPVFESYIVEEEEGSGGYGTVYRARRKSDGMLVAIKCPHASAHTHHVDNELKMLERFGGKNFVIKYEGCFKNEISDCFVLEHVEHERPEVLKKEIDVFHLQWYGYCLFRGLASLHKQGIVHRDVKPGNFLFSSKTNKGYIIDFNLAMDLNQKYRSLDKAKVGSDISHPVKFSSAHIRPSKSRSPLGAELVDAENLEETKGSKSTLELKKMRKLTNQRKASHDLRSRNQINSQGADGSGITSAKDVSTMTPAERLREPLPCQGRKALINFVQETMQNPKHEGSHVPAPLRKRIAASPCKVEKEFLYLTPMPLLSGGVPIAGISLMKNKGDGKYKREGPCAGTKGFRAPEVLLRSQYQGTKTDVWSAGVTLLYLMIGKTPFFGDPEQNIKDIAKLRGSEDLWEVAKLHDRESSFPQELHDTRYLMPTNLRDWCRSNTKRREFLEVIPNSLFDLVNKCLTVNPRLRISAEDALKHDFFAPVHYILKKQRSSRLSPSLGSCQFPS